MRCAPQFDGVVSFNISGTGQAPERVFSDLLESRASQFADEQNDVVKSNAKMFKRNWMACFSPRVATKKSPACNFTNDDVKSYLSQFFCGEAAWGNELPRRQAKKLKDATKPGNIDECKQRLMERRRESALKAVKAEPAKLAALHKEVKDKDESTTSAFFRIANAASRRQAEHAVGACSREKRRCPRVCPSLEAANGEGVRSNQRASESCPSIARWWRGGGDENAST